MARPHKPWFRKGKDTWYATVNGKKISLGIKGRENRRAAYEAWHRLVSEPKAEEKAKPPVSVGMVISAFLADTESRAKAKTMRVYHYFL